LQLLVNVVPITKVGHYRITLFGLVRHASPYVGAKCLVRLSLHVAKTISFPESETPISAIKRQKM
jgi:hypothetical protein